MAYVDVPSEQTADYGTGAHYAETLIASGGKYPTAGDYPSQLRWSNLHPGLVILPKGSPPAGPGQINWEDTLGGQLALALARLEGLLYAVFGSRPAAYERAGGGHDKCQWYDRLHPRCLWGPEIWVPNCLNYGEGCGYLELQCNGNCYDYKYGASEGGLDEKEYVAGGAYHAALQAAFPRPHVPIRSRSGDPQYQYRRGSHARRFFPLGSVEREYQATFPHDPEGYGWFGATNPGRWDHATTPWLKEENGYLKKLGQAVKIAYTLPPEAMVPTWVKLHYRIKTPTGGWGAWQTANMAADGERYEATLSARQHGSECRWYVEYYYRVTPRYGQLIARTADDAGVLELGTGHNLTDRDELDVTWPDGQRLAMDIIASDATTITVSGGTGDPLPPPKVAPSGGTLTARVADNEGVITVDPGHGLSLQNVLDVSWDPDGARTGMQVIEVAETLVRVRGGEGDPLPIVGTDVAFQYDSPVTVERELTVYEPGGTSPPTEEQAYFFCWWVHYNPYGRGLPELLTSYGGRNIRKGTDSFEFDGSETIQPELLNMARFTLSWLGGATCDEIGPTGCRHSYGQPIYHNPRFRHPGEAGEACCLPQTVRFYWSGSNAYPHYRHRGKGHSNPALWDPLDTRPLRNIYLASEDPEQQPTGTQAARMSWRGIDNLYRGDPLDNPHYGGGCSWGVSPAEFELWLEETYDDDAQVYADFRYVGLRPGDVIDAVHVQEIIDAVDYLIRYGVWTHVPVCTRKRTPGSFMGVTCGTRYDYAHFNAIWNEGLCYQGSMEWFLYEWNCRKCMANAYEVGCYTGESYEYFLGRWESGYGEQCGQMTGEFNEYYPGIAEPVPWSKPTWQECMDPCQQAKCRMQLTIRGSNGFEEDPYGLGEDSCGKGWSRDCHCDRQGATATEGCGWHYDAKTCGTDYWGKTHTEYHYVREVTGLSYYLCTPGQAYKGWDDNHGNTFAKQRFGHTWHPGLYVKATGPPGYESSGNRFGDLFACGDVNPASSQAAWFAEVTEVNWAGRVPSWMDQSGAPGCDPTCSWPTLDLPPEVPGWGYFDADGEPICQRGAVDWGTGHDCLCNMYDFGVCRGESVWVAVDLNLDGAGVPYRMFPGRDGSVAPYLTGDGIPVLRDYDLTKDPTTWMHDCPCETGTGAGMCVA